jgi:signal transduction histidine kinase
VTLNGKPQAGHHNRLEHVGKPMTLSLSHTPLKVASVGYDVAIMLAKIAVIVFALEALIMGFLSGWHLTDTVIIEGLTDSILLTITSAPVIYLWVVKPFVTSTHAAREALASELAAKALQAQDLQNALTTKTRLLLQNEDLRERLQTVSIEASEASERALQRIGADLHDGPAQLLSFAVLRLSRIEPIVEGLGNPSNIDEFRRLRAAITDTLREVRNISSGLAPPNIDGATFGETIALAVALHEEHTGTIVRAHVDEIGCDHATNAIRICIYRFVQEALSNCYHHAGGKGQEVTGTINGSRLHVVVSDQGPGFCLTQNAQQGLGLSGLRARIETLGGRFAIQSNPVSGGTRLTANFEFAHQEQLEDAHGTKDQVGSD